MIHPARHLSGAAPFHSSIVAWIKDSPMARPSSPNLSLAQLQKLVQSRTAELGRLNRQRNKLQRRIDTIDARIADLSGGAVRAAGAGGGPGSRVRNAVSLQDLIQQILSKAGKPLAVGDIMEKALAAGYKSNAASFRAIVNQALIKDDRFVAAERGKYQIKK